ncbi:hypothetical protein CVT24_000826 [Panaeolus cyanescens]|uniref:EngC GTPase domain-containing protein n=1 Tax=Panaeolus cyanescens TaxID=181874 RepID=A0A409YY30_9AGAR|nr:hypothetical protein CVT24_000826 [Panaeolus cyanescens]
MRFKLWLRSWFASIFSAHSSRRVKKTVDTERDLSGFNGEAVVEKAVVAPLPVAPPSVETLPVAPPLVETPPIETPPVAPLDISRLKAASVVALSDINGEDDIIIAVMGATGVGKTSFINALAPDEEWLKKGVGHDLSSGTQTVNCIKMKISGTQSHLVLVDTPGFDDPARSNADILTVIGAWLKESYATKKKLNGIVYLHRITDIRFDSGASTTLALFQKICGGDIMGKVCLTTTRWNDVPPQWKHEYEEKEEQLKKGHWAIFLAKKSVTSRFDSSTDETAKDTALKTLKTLVDHAKSRFVAQMQYELVDKKLPVYKTTAGKHAFSFEEKMTAQLFQLSNALSS